MKPTSRIVAYAQITIGGLFLLLVFAFLGVMYWSRYINQLNADALKSFNEWSHWMRDAALIILYFWFQRLREGGIDGANTVTQTVTHPDGSSHTVISPAHLPLPIVGNAPAGAPPSHPTQPPPAATTEK